MNKPALVMLLSLSTLPFVAIADTPAPPPAESKTPSLGDVANQTKENMEKVNDMMNKVNSIMIDCELDSYCFYEKVEKLASTDEGMKPFFEHLKTDKDKIDLEHKNCQSTQLKALRKNMTECMKTSKEQEGLKSCMSSKVDELASQGNLYAQSSLARRADKQGNKEEADKWNQKIEGQKDSEAYKEYKACIQYLN